MTVQTQVVLALLLTDPGVERYGSEIAQCTNLLSGTVYPVLARLVRAGWISDRQEDADPQDIGRPLRRYYRMTDEGVSAARAAMTGAATRLADTVGQWARLTDAPGDQYPSE